MQQATIGACAPITTIRILSTAAGLALLAGCQTTNVGGGDATRAATPSTSVQLIERDVEAPEVFQTTDRALWDGRPSLGGVWVASPDVTEPERVIIRNEETGKFVIGALFKRERLNPGPPLQLSSDAAVALGVLAGSPATLEVVALRREELPDRDAPVAAAEPAPESGPVEVEPEIAAVAAPAAEAAAAPAPEGGSVEVFRVAALALWERQEAARRAAEAAAAIEAPAEAEGAKVPQVTSSALDAPQPEAAVEGATEAAAAAPRRGLGALFGRRPAPEADAAPAPLPEAVTRAVAAGTDAAPAPAAPGYVQIGLFSVEKNARDAARSLAREGVLPTVTEGVAGGRKMWRVMVGPTPQADREAVLRKARDLGFEDAYSVSG